MKKILVLCLLLSTKVFASNSIIAGVSLGQVESTTITSRGFGLSFNASYRINNTVDLLTELQYSKQADVTRLSDILSLEIRPVTMDSLEAIIGIGIGGYRFTNSRTAEIQPGFNTGVTVDILAGKNLRFGPSARVHFVNPGEIGSDFHSIMLRASYLFPI